MKKVMIFICGTALFLLFSTTTFGQDTRKKKSQNDLADKLWYGGGFGLGLSSGTFALELSPMVGYRLTDRLSTGVRIPLEYTYAKLTANDGLGLNYNNLDWGLGVFSRYKLFWNIFAHAEYNYLWVKEPVTSNGFFQLDPSDPTKLLKESYNRDEFNIGLGYASGGQLGTEISLLYNVLDDATSTNIPWTIRVGLNYLF